MYDFTLKFLDTLRVLGFKKAAVRAAYVFGGIKNFDVSDAADTYLYSERSGFSKCTECLLPVVTHTDKRHQLCRDDIQFYSDQTKEAWREYDAELQRDMALDDLAILMDSFCTDPNCYDEGVNYDLKCDKHTDTSDDFQREDFYDPENDECQGECGQTVRTCSCAEVESLRRHNADPATRGSWWVA